MTWLSNIHCPFLNIPDIFCNTRLYQNHYSKYHVYFPSFNFHNNLPSNICTTEALGVSDFFWKKNNKLYGNYIWLEFSINQSKYFRYCTQDRSWNHKTTKQTIDFLLSTFFLALWSSYIFTKQLFYRLTLKGCFFSIMQQFILLLQCD